MKKQIAIYARQSIDKKDSLSIETQIEFCRNNINSNPNELPIEVYADKGYSGKNIQRPEFQRLLSDIKENKIAKIVIYKLDRISRNLLDFTTMYKEFQEHKVEFCSVNETFDTTTATGRAMLKISMVFAEMERENIQLRVKDNYYQRIKTDGRWAGGPAPCGFQNARTADNKPTLEINEKEIDIVKYIFKNYAERPHISLGILCRELTSLGYESRRENKMFDNVTLARILQNPVYCVADQILYKYYEIRGIHFLNEQSAWNGTTSAHIVGKKPGNANVRKYTTLKEQSIYLTNFAGIIDSKTFIQVQERLAQNEQLGKDNRPTNLKEFQGLLKCAKCGYSIKMFSKPYLGCYGARALRCCDVSFKGIKFEQLRENLGIQMKSQLDEVAKKIVADLKKQQIAEKKIKQLKKEIDNLLEVASYGGEPASIVYSKIEEKQRQISELELDAYLDTRVTDRLGLSYDIPVKWNRLSDEQKKRVTHTLINKILLHEDGTLEIFWK